MAPRARARAAGNNKGSGGKAGSPRKLGKSWISWRIASGGPDNKSGGTSSGTKSQQINRPTGDRNGLSGRSIAILHSNGMREEISGGRYEMRDAGGRTIVNRPATQSDLARLLEISALNLASIEATVPFWIRSDHHS